MSLITDVMLWQLEKLTKGDSQFKNKEIYW